MTQRRWRREQIADAIADGQQQTIRRWRHHPDAKRFLADHYLNEWAAIQDCSMRFLFDADAGDRRFVKRRPVRCNRVPFCITCSTFGTWTRVQQNMERFARCTPRGKPPRLMHIVQTARLTEHGDGWGKEASERPQAFARLVFEALKEIYDLDGLGAVMSYQDFGERAFNKRHPHQDLTLNGYALRDGAAVEVPRLDLTNGGRKRWEVIVEVRAQSLRIGATGADFDLGAVFTSFRAYRKLLKYQVREMVDLRKLEYDRERQIVYWIDYTTGHREPMTVGRFKNGLVEYQTRLGVHKAGGKSTHSRWGHLADGKVSKTERAMDGGEWIHDEGCVCANCGEWERIDLTDEEVAMNRAKRIPIHDW